MTVEKYRVEVLGECGGDPPSVFAIKSAREVDEKLLQIAGFVMDGGLSPDEINSLWPLAAEYAAVLPTAQQRSAGAMDSTMDQLLALLHQRPELTCTEIGESLWGGRRLRQSYARPAGKLVKRAIQAGLVCEYTARGRRVFALTQDGMGVET